MATKKLTCTADVSISEQYSGNAYNASNRLAFGRGAASGDRYYALLKFSSLSLDPDLYEITKAVLTVTKITGAVGFSASMNARALRVTSSWSESTTWGNRPSTTTTGQSSTVAMGEGHSGSVNFDVTNIVLAWQGGSGQYGVCLQQSDSTASRIKTIADRTSDNAAYITVTYAERKPEPTTPTVTAPGTVTTDSHTFKWTASSDNVFASDKLSYQVQVSLDGGSTWSSTYTAAAGTTSLAVNLRTLAGLKAKQYYYNAKLKVRVRAVTPSFNGTVYYSSWGVSTVGTINYKITPSKPGSLTLSASAPYEGQQITVTLGRPASYNAYDSSGATMQLTYTVKLKDGTTLGAVTAACTSATAALTITVPSKTSAKSDLSTNVTATVKDAEGQTSAATSAVSMTIKRYRAPAVSISKISRAETSATVTVAVTDTGYGGTQSTGQVSKLEYKLASGSWTAITPTWSGLKTSFALSGLSSGNRYALQMRVTNTAPSGLTSKTATTSGTVLEHTPAAMVYRDGSNGSTGLAIKGLLVGTDWSKQVPEGDAWIEGLMKVMAAEYPTTQLTDDSGNTIAAIRAAVAERLLYFMVYALDSAFYERFYLPAASAGLTASKSYYVLTSKDPVTVTQGGTEATTPLDAATNLLVPSLANVAGERDLVANTDMDTITTPDTYRSPSAAVSATLKNAPPITSAGFRLTVSHLTTAGSFIQTAIYNNATPTIYVRTCNSSGTWGAWKKMLFE